MPISVVIPCFDGEASLAACLEAVVRGLPEGGEILVVDDASTDRTGEIALHHGARLLVHPENRGTSAARNTGWRAARHPVVAFVDADVVLAPDALARMLAALRAEPEALGVNGIYAIDPYEDFVSDFTNLSIHYQHHAHGTRVASAFTGLCALRREALERMDGWDERFFSRYADDVNTRFVLPPGSIHLVHDAQGRHLKDVPLTGLLKHRFNIGWFYVRSMRHHRAAGRARSDNAVLARRYPFNTACALATLLTLPTPLVVLPAAGFVVVNQRFARFVARERGPLAGVAAIGLSAAEGFAYLAGMAASATSLARTPEPVLEPA